jgi:hypothetical protein
MMIIMEILRLLLPICVSLVLAQPVCARQTPDSDATRQARGRLAPPSAVTCDRNQLTSYAGIVKVFRQEEGTTKIGIETDWGSVEEFTIYHDHEKDSGNAYLILGQTMDPDDWDRIESEPGTLKPGTRAIAWTCEDPAYPVIIDWRPDEPALDSD